MSRGKHRRKARSRFARVDRSHWLETVYRISVGAPSVVYRPSATLAQGTLPRNCGKLEALR